MSFLFVSVGVFIIFCFTVFVLICKRLFIVSSCARIYTADVLYVLLIVCYYLRFAVHGSVRYSRHTNYVSHQL